eukprot:1656615-Pyramimonas_sp.AAC.1
MESILRSDACRVTNSEKKRRQKFPRDIAGSRCIERMVASENRSQRAVFVRRVTRCNPIG